MLPLSSEFAEQSSVHLTKREIAELSIRNAIETGLYKPGQVISQRQIGEDLGLSVTPIREAIIVLASNGIVERHSHHSIKVSDIDPKQLRNLFHVRRLLEEEAIALCVRHVDDALVAKLTDINEKLKALVDSPKHNLINALDREFHTAVFSAAKNDALVWAIDRIKSSFPMYALWREPGRLAISVAEHDALIKCLAARDRKGAVAAQRAHLNNGLEATLAFVSRLGTPAD